jgi:hypothetical protein
MSNTNISHEEYIKKYKIKREREKKKHKRRGKGQKSRENKGKRVVDTRGGYLLAS